MSNTYWPEYLPTTAAIRQTFLEEIAALGGIVPDVYDHDERLFARGVLRADSEIRPGDRVCAGVAIRAAGAEILIHPYTFRKVCSNGAIAAQALESRRLERIQSSEVLAPSYDLAVALTDVRLAVRASATEDAFERTTAEMRAAAWTEADFALQLMPLLARVSERMRADILPAIFRRFTTSGDSSAFGLLNAVTSVARDTRDPDARWQLEVLGGALPASLGPRVKTAPGALALA